MRLSMFESNGKKGIVASDGTSFHGLWEDEAGYPGSLEELLVSGVCLVSAGKKLMQANALDPGKACFLPPVSKPGKIICLGLNYAAHSAELGREPPSTRKFSYAWPRPWWGTTPP